MPTFAPKYTDAQREAIVSYIVDGGHTARDAMERAAAGELAGLDAFDMPLTSARYYATEERRRRREAKAAAVKVDDPRAAARELAHGMLERLAREWSRIATTPGNQPIDTARVRDISRAAREALALATAAGATGPAIADTGAAEDAPGLLERLAAAATPGRADHPTTHNGEKPGAAAETREKNGAQSGKRVLGDASESARAAAQALVARGRGAV